MANANAIVEKMAGLGLRHGEKAGVAIAMMVFFLCVGMAVSRPTIDTTPDQVKKAAQASQSNLERHEERDTIIKKLEDTDNIKPTNFAAAVEEQIKVKLVADQFKPLRSWVTPEPGAGLIRDMPELIAPSDLYAYAGRGGLLVYARDEEGNKIPLKEGEDDEKRQQRYGNTKRRNSAGRGGMMGMGGGRKKARKSQADIEREAKAERDRQDRQLKGGLVGDVGKEEPKAEEAKEEGGPFKEITKGYRWVAITGTLDHGQMLANYRTALKNPAIAHPQYIRLDLQRRTQQSDGTWSDWQMVDANKNLDILDNAPDQEAELAPKEVLPEGLVDPLPFLNAGLWEKVHRAELVPKEARELPPEQPKIQRGMGGMMGSMAGSDQMSAMMQMQSKMMSSRSMMQGSDSGMGSMMMSMGGGMGGSESVGNFWKSEEKKVMVRGLDFTVDPNTSYRYRARIVVANPNFNRDDVSPGVDNKKKYLEGPWGKETDVVAMPPDIQPYAVDALPPPPSGGKSGTKVLFQVIRFNPGDGWTVPHRFEAGVGEVIGEPYREAVPRSDGTGTKKEEIDFNSRQIVLDIEGGGNLNLPSGLVGPSIEVPSLAALLRPDGAMVVHNQADDISNEFRRDTAANYKHELDESNANKKRQNSQGSGYSSMMEAMMGGMMRGGGMMGGRGRGGTMGGR
jgi:hypothetical protein